MFFTMNYIAKHSRLAILRVSIENHNSSFLHHAMFLFSPKFQQAAMIVYGSAMGTSLAACFRSPYIPPGACNDHGVHIYKIKVGKFASFFQAFSSP